MSAVKHFTWLSGITDPKGLDKGLATNFRDEHVLLT
jgi:hypothetical protein